MRWTTSGTATAWSSKWRAAPRRRNRSIARWRLLDAGDRQPVVPLHADLLQHDRLEPGVGGDQRVEGARGASGGIVVARREHRAGPDYVVRQDHRAAVHGAHDVTEVERVVHLVR